MELKKVKGLNSEPFQRLLARPDNVAGGKVITVGRVRVRVALLPKAAFRGNENSLAHAGHCFERQAKDAFRLAAAINIGVIKESVAGFVGGNNGAAAMNFAVGGDFRRFPSAGQTPAAIGQPARLERAHSLMMLFP